MSETVDVFWSFRSPYSRLVTADLLRLRDDYPVHVQLRVVLPLAVRNPAALFDPDNRKPVTYIISDSIRRGEMLGRPIVYRSIPTPSCRISARWQSPRNSPIFTAFRSWAWRPTAEAGASNWPTAWPR
jgi:2-hydroxychromene-2-carboxylate isomerase